MIQTDSIELGHTTSLPSMRRPYVLGWAVVAMLSLVDTVWLMRSGHTVAWASLFATFKAAGFLILLAVLLRSVTRIRRYRKVTARLRYARLANTSAWGALLVSFVSATCVLSYLCVSIDAPLIDERLIAFDRVFGFDWPAVYAWVQAHPHAQKALQLAYTSGQVQLLAIPLVLGLFGRREGLPEFFFYLAISSVYLLLISTPFPAASAFTHFNVGDREAVATVSDFALLRDGSLTVIDVAKVQGLVSMPSFHTALAVLFVYSLRELRWLLYIAVPLNLAMIASTPTQGGHYLADLVAGLLLSALTVSTYRWIAGPTARANPQRPQGARRSFAPGSRAFRK